MRRGKCIGAALILAALAAGCGARDGGSSTAARAFAPIDADAVEFWDRQTTTTADLLGQLVDEFNATGPPLPLNPVQTGNYGDIYRKSIAAIKAGTLPGLAAAYENMTAEYAKSGAVTPLDAFIDHPELGFSPEDRADFFPAMLETNTFEQFGGQLLSFPYTKSVLVLYYNKNVLRAAGHEAPPATWDAFLTQCRDVKRKTGKFAIALDVDCSTISGMIFSMGGAIIEDGAALYDAPPSIQAFELIETLVTEKLAYQNPPRTFNDETAFANNEIAFTIRTSAQWSYLENLMPGHDSWGIAPIPQSDPANPKTVLFGGNFCVFNTTDAHAETAWRFIRFFTSTDVSVRWSLATGYLPVRRSAAQHPDMMAWWESWPDNRVPFDCLEFARAEPNVAGWQEIRGLVENAETAVITGVKTGRNAALDLKREADAVLNR